MTQSFTQLTSTLWVAQSKFYATNSGVFYSEGQACLIDPCMLPAEIAMIERFLVEQNLQPQTILLTHSHWDHIFGPEHFPGVKIVAHENYLTEVSGGNGLRIERQVKMWEADNNIDRPSDRPFRIPQPDEVFADTTTLVVSNDLTLTLAHAPGHASDQLVAYHAPSETLWASDILSDLEIPFISDSLKAFEQTLAMVSEWEIRVLIPGHGHPTDSLADIRGRISDDMDYLSELRGRVEEAIGQGKSVEETVDLCADMTYRDPEENRGPHKLNVQSTFIELGGDADPAKVGWSAVKNGDE